MDYDVSNEVWLKLVKSEIKPEKLVIQLVFNRLRLGIKTGKVTDSDIVSEKQKFFSKHNKVYLKDLELMTKSIS